jgi:very-short-patch-repair endonuclease
MIEITREQKINPIKLKCAKKLRREMTRTEKILWNCLRKNQLNGFHFRRQQIIDGFIADFYCDAAKLVIEVDGAIHALQTESDNERDNLFLAKGLKVLRIQNEEIIHNFEYVLIKILSECMGN